VSEHLTRESDTADLEAWLDAHEIGTVRVGATAIEPLLIGKYTHRRKFVASLPKGPAVVEFALGSDRELQPYVGFWGDWRQKTLGDIHLQPDLSTMRVVPGQPGVATCLGDFVDVEGVAIPLCGRGTARRLTERLAEHGFTSKFAFEIEGQFFHESFAEARANRWHRLEPIGVGLTTAYLHQDHHLLYPMMSEVCSRLEAFGVPWEAWNAEAAPGQFELNLSPDDPVSAADHVVIARQVLKEVALEHGHSVTFMARVTSEYGNGLHIHHSLTDSDGPAFYDADAPNAMSALAGRWVSGLMATAPGAISLLAPSINSYRRVQGFIAVPTHLTWGGDNKSTMLRVLTRSAGSARIEHRAGAGDMQPYYGVSAILAGGLAGLENELELPPRFEKLAWSLPEEYERLPGSITQASDALASDNLLRGILGDGFVEYWVGSRRYEWLQFHTSGADALATKPTEWEMERYFETS